MPGRDNRRYERFDILLEGTFSSSKLVCSNAILNISLGGLCMECSKPLDVGEGVTIILPLRPPIKVYGRVAWCRKDGLSHKIGIKFNDLTQEQKRAITQLISSLFWEKQMAHD